MRTLFVGDVHGCRDELERLLETTGFTTGDRLVFCGDLVARGPDSRGVLEVARQNGALVVRGNHDQKLLAWRRGEQDKFRISNHHLEVARSLRDADWQVLESSVLYLDLPEHDVRVVHGGVDPTVPIEAQRPEVLMNIRTVGEDGALWGERYQGPPHVVFGHNAVQKLQIHAWATGLDTGCVYGGALTGLLLGADQRVPKPRAERLRLITSMPAARVYYDPHQ